MSPPVPGKWCQILLRHWWIIMIVVVIEIFIIAGAVHFTYLLSTHPPCETDSVTSTVSSVTEVSTSSAPLNNINCTPGFTNINNKCLQLVTNRKTREHADSTCMGYGGSTLFSIRDEQENKAILDFVSKSVVDILWTGLICEMGKSSPTYVCTWDKESGTAAGFDNFSEDFPNNTSGNCVYFIATGSEAGHWKSGSCNQTMSFICELPSTIHDDDCINNYNNHCYLRYDRWNSIAVGQHVCETLCANLLSINSANENRYVQSIYYDVPDGNIILGAAVPYYGEIYWLDGSPPVYDNILLNANGTCVFMSLLSGGNGPWNTVQCTEKTWFLCKRPTGIVCSVE